MRNLSIVGCARSAAQDCTVVMSAPVIGVELMLPMAICEGFIAIMILCWYKNSVPSIILYESMFRMLNLRVSEMVPYEN